MADAMGGNVGPTRSRHNMVGFSLDTRFTIPPHIRHITDNEGATILDFRRNQHVTLNSTGGRLWALVVAGLSVGELTDVLAHEFQLPAATALSDAGEFLSQLTQLGIIERPTNSG
jgi:hypothetical protein